jgi:hypothetical protein
LRTTNYLAGQVYRRGADPLPNRGAPPLLRNSFSIRLLPNRYLSCCAKDAMQIGPKLFAFDQIAVFHPGGAASVAALAPCASHQARLKRPV